LNIGVFIHLLLMIAAPAKRLDLITKNPTDEAESESDLD